MSAIKITLPSGKILQVAKRTKVHHILQDEEFQSLSYTPIAVLINNTPASLNTSLKADARVEAVTVDTETGYKIYRRSLSFLLAIASKELFPERELVIGHSLGDGFYYYYNNLNDPAESDVKALENKMRELVHKYIPIKRQRLPYDKALKYFRNAGMSDTALLLEHQNSSLIPVNRCGNYMDLFHSPLVPNTSYLKIFELKHFPPGFLLRFPSQSNPLEISEFKESPMLFSVYQEYKAWGKILNLNSVGKLNKLSENQQIRDFIRVAEALHNKKIAEIADKIQERRESVKIVLISGPSSSGKTTFTKKLAIQLRVLGFNPVIISLDDYFVSRDKTPRDENGEYDFEALQAIDVELLNQHLLALFQGKEVEIPIFDFKQGKRKEKGRALKMDRRNILLMEGIHGLNDRLTPRIETEKKYKIYLSALTQLNLDGPNRIPTTDNRLIRRIVRDYNFRGHKALDTLKRWPSVRRGENKNIFPFQDNADAAFNSALDYELAVLKVYAEPLLKSVKPYDREYSKAYSLLNFLDNFRTIPSKYVADDSILREFIGDSGFKY